MTKDKLISGDLNNVEACVGLVQYSSSFKKPGSLTDEEVRYTIKKGKIVFLD